MVSEMEKALQFYQTKRGIKIETMILSGGSSVLPELVVILAERLSLEIQIGDPFARMEKTQTDILEKIPAGLAPTYATAIGLALKSVS